MKRAVCYGEILWDILPTGKVAGGAPMNVAFHLTNFGIPTKMVSKVGTDEFGDSLLTFLNEKGIDTDLIEKDRFYQTGIVYVTFPEPKSPSYDIAAPAAWDFIELSKPLISAVSHSNLFVYGSLSTRNPISRATLLDLLDIAPFKVFDVNLRPPTIEKSLLESLMAKANIIKMNEEELKTISSWYTDSKDERKQLEDLKMRFKLDGLLLTKGSDGALYFSNGEIFRQKVFPVEVVDTVGSGDSFLAGFLSQFLSNKEPAECLTFACATGALVASRRGGTPFIKENEVLRFISKKRK